MNFGIENNYSGRNIHHIFTIFPIEYGVLIVPLQTNRKS